MDSVIEDIRVRKVFDSLGNPTIEVDVITWNGFGRATAPTGVNTSLREVQSFPQGGVDQVISEVEYLISSELIGMSAEDIEDIDLVLKEIDGTDDLSAIGANTAIAVSMAVAKAAAVSYNIPLYSFLGGNFVNKIPYPLVNVMNGGVNITNVPDIKEFLVVPIGANDIKEAIFANVAIHKKLKELIAKNDSNFSYGKAVKGGWIPNISNDKALEIQAKACEEISDELGFLIKSGLDIAASDLWDKTKEKYVYSQDNIERDAGEQFEYIKDLIETYNMFYIEDPFDKNDYEGFRELTAKFKDKSHICGDDLFVSNLELLVEGIDKELANTILIKPNQIGFLSDTYATVKLAKENKIMPIISHRSGETTDDTIAQLSVAFGTPMIKTGAIGGERIAKLNELIRIEEELNNPKMADLF
ncbi:MAG: phosphopyruvate hydratase [Methanobacteriaceae archaeon]|nr:phosphopyruvate hydratase [Methanobacteriaceae archaeon]